MSLASKITTAHDFSALDEKSPRDMFRAAARPLGG
jgi:hypothetical protein